MTDRHVVSSRNGDIDVAANPSARRVHVEGAFDVIQNENLVRVRFYDLVGLDGPRPAGIETLVLSLTRQAAEELVALVGQVLPATGGTPKPAPARPKPAADPRTKIAEI